MEEVLGEREMRIKHAKTNVDSMNMCVVCAMRTVLFAVIIIFFSLHSVKQRFINTEENTMKFIHLCCLPGDNEYGLFLL